MRWARVEATARSCSGVASGGEIQACQQHHHGSALNVFGRQISASTASLAKRIIHEAFMNYSSSVPRSLPNALHSSDDLTCWTPGHGRMTMSNNRALPGYYDLPLCQNPSSTLFTFTLSLYLRSAVRRCLFLSVQPYHLLICSYEGSLMRACSKKPNS